MVAWLRVRVNNSAGIDRVRIHHTRGANADSPAIYEAPERASKKTPSSSASDRDLLPARLSGSRFVPT